MTVTEVVDGDTLDIRYRNGTTDTLRLLAVDTAEVHMENAPSEFEGVPNTQAGADCLREEGYDASVYMTQLVANEQIRIRVDAQSDRRGSYGRLLVYVYHKGKNVNGQLVRQGYARVYTAGTASLEAEFLKYEQTAQEQGLGVWRCRAVQTPTPTPTESGDGGGSGSLAVAAVHADAEGNDHENENDEYIVFENPSENALDLSGWTISDEAGHTYSVPSGFSLGAGEQVTLYTGSGQDTARALYWGSDSAIWNNGGDTIIVRNADGETILEYVYQ